MKPLHELLKSKVVNCQTEDEAKDFLSFMHENGYKWMAGNSLIEKNYWSESEDDTCYCINERVKRLSFSCVSSEKGVITYQQFKQFINNENMETKEVKIQVPEGYEIDKENSTFKFIKFKPIKKVLTYEDVAKELFLDENAYYIGNFGGIGLWHANSGKDAVYPNICTSEKQTKKLLAINKLMNVAKYLNGEWRPNCEDSSERKYYIEYYDRCNKYSIGSLTSVGNVGQVLFKSEEAAKQAVEILDEETIKLALSTDW